MSITSKQRAYLRSLGSVMTPILTIGKDGVNAGAIHEADDALEARELFKVAVLNNSPVTARETCGILCEELHAEPVQCIGNKFIIYRESVDHKKIVLE